MAEEKKRDIFCMYVNGKDNIDFLTELSELLGISKARTVNTIIRYYRLGEGQDLQRFVKAMQDTKAEQLAERRARNKAGNLFQPGTGRRPDQETPGGDQE